MAQFGKKKKIQAFLHSRLFLLVFLAVIVLLGSRIYGLYRKDREVSISKAIAAKEVEVLQTKQTELETEINDLGTDRGLEEAIREKFRVTKEGENLIVIPATSTPSQTAAAVDAAQPVPTKSSGFFSFFKDWFKK